METSKCDYCKKKTGIMVFNCKCKFKKLCGKCRLPETHECKFNFKKAGQEEILKQNPVVIADKITKI